MADVGDDAAAKRERERERAATFPPSKVHTINKLDTARTDAGRTPQRNSVPGFDLEAEEVRVTVPPSRSAPCLPRCPREFTQSSPAMTLKVRKSIDANCRNGAAQTEAKKVGLIGVIHASHSRLGQITQ